MFSHSRTLKLLRIFQGYKHIRFKASQLSTVKNLSQEDSFVHRSEILCELLHCNIHTAREIIAKDKEIVEHDYNDFYQNVRFCSKFFKISDLIENPCLLTLQPSLLQHRYFSLKELGFYSVSPYYIFRFTYILKKTPKALKAKGFSVDYKHKSDILTEYLDTTKRTEINNNLQQMYKDGSNLQEIRKVMNAEFFAAKLGCSIGKAHEILHNYSALRVQSICNTDKLLNVLSGRYGFSASKVCSSINVLSVHYEAAEIFINEIPEILGVNTVFIVNRLPLILKQHCDTIHKMEAILKDFNITKDQLICCPKVLSISPDTLYKRLTVVCNTEEFAVLQSNKKFLWFVYNFKNLNYRLKRLKDENIPCSINMFTVKKSTFEKYIMHDNSRVSIREAYTYLANVFKMSDTEVLTRLHCYYSNRIGVQNFSALNCQKVIEFLLLSGVTKEQIFNGLEIVFYKVDTVKVFFKNLEHHNACQPFEEWISHFNLIQLLIYTIEVIEYHSNDDQSLEHS